MLPWSASIPYLKQQIISDERCAKPLEKQLNTLSNQKRCYGTQALKTELTPSNSGQCGTRTAGICQLSVLKVEEQSIYRLFIYLSMNRFNFIGFHVLNSSDDLSTCSSSITKKIIAEKTVHYNQIVTSPFPIFCDFLKPDFYFQISITVLIQILNTSQWYQNVTKTLNFKKIQTYL